MNTEFFSRNKECRRVLFVVSICALPAALAVLTFVCIESFRGRGARAFALPRNKADNQNNFEENANFDATELSIRRSFYKKNIDATLARSQLKKLKESMKSVGILFMNSTGQGTVVRIGPKHIITAWHVIKPIVSPPGKVDRQGRTVNSANLKALSSKDTICVDFNENTRHGDSRYRFGLLPKICLLDKSLDICILELNGDANGLPKPITVYRDFEGMSSGTTTKFVHVIGQHPDTQTIVVDPGCEIILHDDEKVKKAKKWIRKHKREISRHGDMESNLGKCYDVFGTKRNLVLDTYLEFGASGAAVISITSAGEVALVGILMRGLPSWFWTECSRERGFASLLRMEVACSITEILSSKEWIDSEKDQIFGQYVLTGGSDDMGDQMETDQSERCATRQDHNSKDNDMETDQLERGAVDNQLSRL